MKTMYDLSEDEKRTLLRDLMAVVKSNGSYKDLADKHNVAEHVIVGLAGRLRKAGVPVPKRSASSVLTPEFINELRNLLS